MLISIPTPIRKNGINKDVPTNSILFMSGEVWGISLFSNIPATNAPIIGSNPASSAKKAQAKTIVSTKIKCEFFSDSNTLKNHAAILGKI